MSSLNLIIYPKNLNGQIVTKGHHHDFHFKFCIMVPEVFQGVDHQ